MVNSSHEAMHRVFQADPGLFARTFQALGLGFGEPSQVTLLPTDLTETSPLERRVDTLIHFETTEPESSFLLAVEAQSRKDPAKPASWAYYLAYLYTKYRIPPVLLVVCRDRGTATWATGPMDIGPRIWPSLTVRPLVLGPHNVPAVTDADTAARDIPLAALSAITHSQDPDIAVILKALAAALKPLDDDTASIFIELTEQGLGTTPAAQIWRHLMAVDLSFFRSETSRRLRAEGHAEGRAEGRAEDILLLLERRGIAVADTERERITACGDLPTLRTWFTRAITAASTAEIFTHE